MDPKRFVRKVWQGLPRRAPRVETGKWTMGQGVVWIRRPEMWCPHCEVSWVNGWTWLVDERKGRVIAVWDEAGEKLYLGDLHPHIMFSGEMCLGDGSVMAALTSGFNILSCFCGTEAFVEVMAGLGHKGCGQEDRVEEEEEEDDRMTCESCYDRFDYDDISFYDAASQYLCDGCWREVSVRCDNCHDRFYYPGNGLGELPVTEVRGGDELCGACLEDYTYCEECEQMVHEEDMRPWVEDEDPICKRCWRDARSECQECGRLELKEEVTDGICDSCDLRIKAEEAALEKSEQELDLLLDQYVDDESLTAEEVEDGTAD